MTRVLVAALPQFGRSDASRCGVSVADRGSGIDDSEQTLIFERFYRGKDHRYAVQGIGVGLPIASAIIIAHGGTLSVTSRRGHGSIFSFTLPIDQKL